MNILKWKQFLESIGEIPIFDIDIYNKRMEIGWEDKLFFLNKINPDVIIDFGCADGAILVKIKNKNPDIKLIGYEPDEKMLSIAKSHLDGAFLSSDWNEVVEEVSKYSKPAILLSSVIHEVYSYSHQSDIKKFWDQMVFSGVFKWICIRDMMPSIQINNNIENFSNDISNIRKNIDPHLINSYEEIWGEIKDYKSLMHFLLKYKYVENWDREVEENYFPLMLEELYALIPNGYQITYQESFLLPHLPKQFKDDFEIDINKKTHTKIIITNKKFETKLNESDDYDYNQHASDIEFIEDIFLEYIDRWNMKHGKYMSDITTQPKGFDHTKYNLWYTIYESFSPKISRIYVPSDYYIELNVEAHVWKGDIDKDELIADIDKFVKRIKQYGWNTVESTVSNRKTFLNVKSGPGEVYDTNLRYYLYKD